MRNEESQTVAAPFFFERSAVPRVQATNRFKAHKPTLLYGLKSAGTGIWLQVRQRKTVGRTVILHLFPRIITAHTPAFAGFGRLAVDYTGAG